MQTGTLIGIIAGLLIALPIYRLSLRDPELRYSLSGSVIVDASSESEIEVRRSGVLVPRVTTTRVLIWNGGRGAFRKGQIATNDPIVAYLPTGARLLAAALSDSTNVHAVNLHPTSPEHTEGAQCLISAEFLNAGDSIEILLTHTGTNWSDVVVSGTVIGQGPISQVTGGEELFGRLLIIGFGLLVLEVWVPTAIFPPDPVTNENDPWAVGTFGILLVPTYFILKALHFRFNARGRRLESGVLWRYVRPWRGRPSDANGSAGST